MEQRHSENKRKKQISLIPTLIYSSRSSVLKQTSIHPSIFLLCILFGVAGGWSLSQMPDVKCGTSWTGRRFITGSHRDKQPHGSFRITNGPNAHVSGLWNEARTAMANRCMRRTHRKLCRGWFQLRLNPQISTLWDHSDDHNNAAAPLKDSS